jgi:DegV family protein with EDD domain
VTGTVVVTDSTADLPDTTDGVEVVALSVAFGDETFVPGETIDAEGFYARLASSATLPVTSQPTPDAFARTYARLAAAGARQVVSVHCSSALSSTVDSARVAAQHAPVPVRVVDSRLVGGVLGLAVLAAARIADAGGDADAVVAAVERVRDQGVGLLVVDTLEYLRRGGRLSGPQAALGTALRVKPLLHVIDGRVEVRERARTLTRALGRAVDVVEGVASGGDVDVMVVHAAVPERAAALAEQIDGRVRVRARHVAEIGPIVGAHVGPGAVGVAAVPAD